MSPEGGGSGVTPELEIAWARAISRAVDDPAFAQRLEQSPSSALAELGVDVPEGVDLKRDLNPTLDNALPAIARYRAALAAGQRGGYGWGAAPIAYAYPQQPAGPVTPYIASVHPLSVASHAPAPPPPPAPQQPAAPIATGQASLAPSTYAPPAAIPVHVACYIASLKLMCGCAAGAGGAAEQTPSTFNGPRWLGGRPSTGGR